jgi:hypothetical protein
MDEAVRDRKGGAQTVATHNPFADLKEMLNKKSD